MNITAPGFIDILGIEYSDIALSGALDQSATATGATTSIALPPLVTSQNNELIFATAFVGAAGETWTPGSGFQLLESNQASAVEGLIGSLAGSYSSGFTVTNANNWAGVAATFRTQ